MISTESLLSKLEWAMKELRMQWIERDDQTSTYRHHLTTLAYHGLPEPSTSVLLGVVTMAHVKVAKPASQQHSTWVELPALSMDRVETAVHLALTK
jgi:hypothetical protein